MGYEIHGTMNNGMAESFDYPFRVTAQRKSPDALHQGFFFVDKRFEISNYGLIKDIADLIKLVDVFPISPDHVG